VVAKGYRPVDRDQEFLLPPNMTDWLPEHHLVWFVIDTVAALDTSGFLERAARRRDGQTRRSAAGRAAYDPVMLLTLLIYGYACGERSSRQIERLCTTDVAFRVICAQDVPDHAVISRFRKMHLEAFADLFAQVLRLCREAGLARLGTVAIDGTKIAANASRQANRSADWLDTEIARMDRAGTGLVDTGLVDAGRADQETVARILAEAGHVDAAEDDQYGPGARGDELPPGFRGRAGRAERLRAARAKIEAEQAAAQAEAERAAAERAERDRADLTRAETALAEEITTRQAAREDWEAKWERAMTEPGAPLPRGAAPKPVEQARAVMQAQRRVAKARDRLTRPGPSARRARRRDTTDQDKPTRANITDPDSAIMLSKNGWLQAYNVQVGVSADQIIVATEVSTSPVDIVSYHRMVAKTEHAAADLDATSELGTLLLDTGYCSNDTLTAPGPDRLIATGKTRSIRQAARDNPTTGPPPPGVTARDAMDHRLRTPEGAALYSRRGATVEPGIGNLKKILERFSMRGLTAATAENHLAAAVFNLLKLHRAATS
jgi:transposase